MAQLVLQRRGLSLWSRLTGGGASSAALTTKGDRGSVPTRAPPQTARSLYREIMRFKDRYPLGATYFRDNVRFLFHKYGDVKDPAQIKELVEEGWRCVENNRARFPARITRPAVPVSRMPPSGVLVGVQHPF